MKIKYLPLLVILFVVYLSACSHEPETVNVTEIAETEATAIPTGTAQPTYEASTRTPETEETAEEVLNQMKLTIGNYKFTATLADNSSVEALLAMLEKGPISIDMRDYGNMEKVGPLGANLPRNDEQITTQPGDLILYQGNALVIYYAPNSWNFTRIGKINEVTQEELMQALGKGGVKVTLSLEKDN